MTQVAGCLPVSGVSVNPSRSDTCIAGSQAAEFYKTSVSVLLWAAATALHNNAQRSRPRADSPPLAPLPRAVGPDTDADAMRPLPRNAKRIASQMPTTSSAQIVFALHGRVLRPLSWPGVSPVAVSNRTGWPHFAMPVLSPVCHNFRVHLFRLHTVNSMHSRITMFRDKKVRVRL